MQPQISVNNIVVKQSPIAIKTSDRSIPMIGLLQKQLRCLLESN